MLFVWPIVAIFEKLLWLTNKKDTPSNKSEKPSTSQNEPTTTGLLKNKKQVTCNQKKHGPRKRKINPQKLKQYVEEHPNAYLKELAQQFNCKTSSIYNA